LYILHKIDLKEEFRFFHRLGLSVAVFKKDFKKLYKSLKELNIFIVVIQSRGDTLYYSNVLLKGRLNRLRN
jgi:hypothetical protein